MLNAMQNSLQVRASAEQCGMLRSLIKFSLSLWSSRDCHWAVFERLVTPRLDLACALSARKQTISIGRGISDGNKFPESASTIFFGSCGDHLLAQRRLRLLGQG